MTLARRQFLSLAAGAAALPAFHRAAWAQAPLAESVEAYDLRLSYEEIDA
jgi:hypothetical protein